MHVRRRSPKDDGLPLDGSASADSLQALDRSVSADSLALLGRTVSADSLGHCSESADSTAVATEDFRTPDEKKEDPRNSRVCRAMSMCLKACFLF